MQRTRPKLNDGRPGSNLSADLSGISKTAGVCRVLYSVRSFNCCHIRTSYVIPIQITGEAFRGDSTVIATSMIYSDPQGSMDWSNERNERWQPCSTSPLPRCRIQRPDMYRSWLDGIADLRYIHRHTVCTCPGDNSKLGAVALLKRLLVSL